MAKEQGPTDDIPEPEKPEEPAWARDPEPWSRGERGWCREETRSAKTWTESRQRVRVAGTWPCA